MATATQANPQEIVVSDKALAKLQQLREQAGIDADHFLRVSVTGGGCSGLTYNLDFDNEEQPGDQFFENGPIKVVCNLKSFLYLAGTVLEFSDGLDGKGFNFVNPNAARECGCGESFGV
ncbi:MAG: HesB/IscA family protein [Bacteroidota bacterium]